MYMLCCVVFFPLLRYPPYEFKNLKVSQSSLKNRHQLWSSLATFNLRHKQWMTLPFMTVDVEELNKEVAVLLKTAFVLDKKVRDAACPALALAWACAP